MTAEDLLKILEPEAAKLGMKITRVTRTDYSFKIDVRLVAQKTECEIDEEVFYLPFRGSSAFAEPVPNEPSPGYAVAELLARTLEDTQLHLHDLTRNAMDKLDARQRIVQLSKADKNTLYEMLNDAELQELATFRHGAPQAAAPVPSKIERYRALVGKLMR